MNSRSDDTYRTLRAPAQAEIKREGSRFIAEAFPVPTEEDAQARLETVREREHRATHHCWAYRLRPRLGPEGARFRYDDDGEPTGTAGPPILRQLDACDLTDVLAVVTRHYGGTKLGTGGLARAYGDACAEALAMADVREQVRRLRVEICFDYDDTGPARRLVERFGATVEAEHYGTRTTLEVGVPRSQAATFRRAFRNATAGRGESTLVDE